MSYKFKITLFTPAYNRAYIIENLYRSLQRQTFRDFEWIIVDDGSTDNTEELVKSWIDDGNDFPIRYCKRENGGKCRAINYGLDLAEGELFFNVDSDDYLTDDALEKIVLWEKSLHKNSSVKYCGVVGNLGTSPTETPNRPYPYDYRDASFFERYDGFTDNPIDGERAWIFYTDVHRKYKYPEIEGEKFMTECISWNRMAHDGYKIRVFDDIICIYEYQPEGLTANINRNFIENPRGAGLWQREKANFLNYSLKEKMKMWYTFYCDHTSCDEKYSLTKKQCAEYIGAPKRFIYAVAFFRRILSVIR